MKKKIILILILISFAVSSYAQIPQSQTLTISATIPGDTGGNGGSSGGGYLVPTSVTFSGYAYPSSKISLLKDGQIILNTITDINSNFHIFLDNNLTTGNYLFSIIAEDSTGKKSTIFNIPLFITLHTATTVSGIFISPTITTDKIMVTQGEDIKIFGQSLPNSIITIFIKDTQGEEIIRTTNSNSEGFYFLNFNTSFLKYGFYQVKSRAFWDVETSPFSQIIVFNVGFKNILIIAKENCNIKADLNKDCFINIADFNILNYWHKKINFPLKMDLNNDNIINITDFSIMAYYWTG